MPKPRRPEMLPTESGSHPCGTREHLERPDRIERLDASGVMASMTGYPPFRPWVGMGIGITSLADVLPPQLGVLGDERAE